MNIRMILLAVFCVASPVLSTTLEEIKSSFASQIEAVEKCLFGERAALEANKFGMPLYVASKISVIKSLLKMLRICSKARGALLKLDVCEEVLAFELVVCARSLGIEEELVPFVLQFEFKALLAEAIAAPTLEQKIYDHLVKKRCEISSKLDAASRARRQ